MVVVAARLPQVPVTVTVAFPLVTESFAFNVSLLVPLPLMLLGLNDAVTPPGRPDAARLTLPVNPLATLNAIAAAPPGLPWMIVRLRGEAESAKLGAGRASIRFCPFGLPHPVTRS